MGIEYKSREQMIEDTILELQSKLGEDIDLTDGQPLRTFIEVILQELDYQYWQLQQAYDSAFIDTAIGEDLTKLVKLLGIERKTARGATGIVKFYRETPAISDYLIPVGTLVETLPDNEGNFIRFETTENVVLETGALYVYANIKALDGGADTNVVANRILVINDPPLGIESVVNEEPTIGGEEEQTDEELRNEALFALDTSGKGTIPAITNIVLSVAGVKSVKVLDMQRGIGTADIMILGDVMPLPQAKLDELNSLINSVKAGGIDIQISEPLTSAVNLTINIEKAQNADFNTIITEVEKTVDEYFDSLEIGETIYKSKLSAMILNSLGDKANDIVINTTDDLVPGENEILIKGTISIGEL
jgi:uncharacterized phage protein gp47/JayE